MHSKIYSSISNIFSNVKITEKVTTFFGKDNGKWIKFLSCLQLLTSFNIIYLFWQDNVPVIGVMCNKGMRPRHWSKMSELMGFDITPNAGTTLRKVLKLEIAPHMEMFEGISAAATKVRDGVQDIGNFRLVY